MRNLLLFVLTVSTLTGHSHNGRWEPGPGFSPQSAGATGREKKAKDGQEPLAEAGATSSSRLASAFKRSWQYITDNAAAIPPTLDGERIYLPLAGGKVVCLERETGTLLWSAELGGIISAPVAVGDKSLFISTRKIAEDGSVAGASLRAVDKSTGLTLWLRDYARPFTSPLTLAGGRIFAGSADGSLYALSEDGGELIWQVKTQDVVRGRPLVTETLVYFGGDDGALRGVEIERGREVWKFQTGGKIAGRPAIDKRALYFGSADGYIYSVDLSTGKLRWRARTGAAVAASTVVIGDRVLAASFDNFIYALSSSSGDRIWKRRLENRIASDPIVEGDAAMVAPLRGNQVIVFLTSDGRRVSFYQLEPESEIVADPLFSDDTLVLATNKGIVVATATRGAEPRADVIKK